MPTMINKGKKEKSVTLNFVAVPVTLKELVLVGFSAGELF